MMGLVWSFSSVCLPTTTWQEGGHGQASKTALVKTQPCYPFIFEF